MDPSLEREPEALVSDLTDALLDKLGQISLVWTDTFAASPVTSKKGFANLRYVEKKYGRANVRDVFTYCIDKKISPQGDSAIPLVVSLCKAVKGKYG